MQNLNVVEIIGGEKFRQTITFDTTYFLGLKDFLDTFHQNGATIKDENGVTLFRTKKFGTNIQMMELVAKLTFSTSFMNDVLLHLSSCDSYTSFLAMFQQLENLFDLLILPEMKTVLHQIEYIHIQRCNILNPLLKFHVISHLQHVNVYEWLSQLFPKQIAWIKGFGDEKFQQKKAIRKEMAWNVEYPLLMECLTFKTCPKWMEQEDYKKFSTKHQTFLPLLHSEFLVDFLRHYHLLLKMRYEGKPFGSYWNKTIVTKVQEMYNQHYNVESIETDAMTHALDISKRFDFKRPDGNVYCTYFYDKEYQKSLVYEETVKEKVEENVVVDELYLLKNMFV